MGGDAPVERHESVIKDMSGSVITSRDLARAMRLYVVLIFAGNVREVDRNHGESA